jgi:hypothetical protein
LLILLLGSDDVFLTKKRGRSLPEVIATKLARHDAQWENMFMTSSAFRAPEYQGA